MCSIIQQISIGAAAYDYAAYEWRLIIHAYQVHGST